MCGIFVCAVLLALSKVSSCARECVLVLGKMRDENNKDRCGTIHENKIHKNKTEKRQTMSRDSFSSYTICDQQYLSQKKEKIVNTNTLPIMLGHLSSFAELVQTQNCKYG